MQIIPFRESESIELKAKMEEKSQIKSAKSDQLNIKLKKKINDLLTSLRLLEYVSATKKVIIFR